MSKRGFHSNEAAAQAVTKVLESDFWLPTLSVGTLYERQHDDTDGKPDGGCIHVIVGADGDAWVWTDTHQSLRFRAPLGGGRNPRVRNALLVLAEAIRLDNEDEAKRRKR